MDDQPGIGDSRLFDADFINNDTPGVAMGEHIRDLATDLLSQMSHALGLPDDEWRNHQPSAPLRLPDPSSSSQAARPRLSHFVGGPLDAHALIDESDYNRRDHTSSSSSSAGGSTTAVAASNTASAAPVPVSGVVSMRPPPTPSFASILERPQSGIGLSSSLPPSFFSLPDENHAREHLSEGRSLGAPSSSAAAVTGPRERSLLGEMSPAVNRLFASPAVAPPLFTSRLQRPQAHAAPSAPPAVVSAPSQASSPPAGITIGDFVRGLKNTEGFPFENPKIKTRRKPGGCIVGINSSLEFIVLFYYTYEELDLLSKASEGEPPDLGVPPNLYTTGLWYPRTDEERRARTKLVRSEAIMRVNAYSGNNGDGNRSFAVVAGSASVVEMPNSCFRVDLAPLTQTEMAAIVGNRKQLTVRDGRKRAAPLELVEIPAGAPAPPDPKRQRAAPVEPVEMPPPPRPERRRSRPSGVFGLIDVSHDMLVTFVWESFLNALDMARIWCPHGQDRRRWVIWVFQNLCHLLVQNVQFPNVSRFKAKMGYRMMFFEEQVKSGHNDPAWTSTNAEKTSATRALNISYYARLLCLMDVRAQLAPYRELDDESSSPAPPLLSYLPPMPVNVNHRRAMYRPGCPSAVSHSIVSFLGVTMVGIGAMLSGLGATQMVEMRPLANVAHETRTYDSPLFRVVDMKHTTPTVWSNAVHKAMQDAADIGDMFGVGRKVVQ